VIATIGERAHRLAAAEEEVRASGIADRPAAGLFGKFEDAAPLADGDDIVDVLGLRI
jgi:hypothetical protein